jgi:hypothetical protein
MKKNILLFLAAASIVGGVSAKSYTNHTFLTTRSMVMNLPLEYTTWHNQVSAIDEDRFGGSVQATAFYSASCNKRDLGKYLGAFNTNLGQAQDFISVSYKSIPRFIGADTSAYGKETCGGTANVDYDATHVLSPLDVFHLAGSDWITAANRAGLTLDQKLTLRPKVSSYGIRLDYHQKLDGIKKGLFFKARMPIARVKTSLGYTGSATKQNLTVGPLGSAVAPSTVLTGESKSFEEYLTGKVSNSDINNKQSTLSKAKFHKGKSKTGVADLDLMIGYNFLYAPDRHANINFAMTIPTGNTPKGEWMFEPVVGGHGHWAAGFGMDSSFDIWTCEKGTATLDVVMAFDYRYLLKGTEKRTIPFTKRNSTIQEAWSQYLLIGTHGTKGLQPAANVTTQDVNVFPGSHLDAMIDFSLGWKWFSFDFGYNLFIKESEHVKIKSWTDNKYAVAAWDMNVDTQNFNVYQSANGYNQIQQTDLLPDKAATPSVCTHKLFAGAGFSYDSWKFPVFGGVSGSYEFTPNNNAPRKWELGGKLGISF